MGGAAEKPRFIPARHPGFVVPTLPGKNLLQNWRAAGFYAWSNIPEVFHP
jgi:hypothetical protein